MLIQQEGLKEVTGWTLIVRLSDFDVLFSARVMRALKLPGRVSENCVSVSK